MVPVAALSKMLSLFMSGLFLVGLALVLVFVAGLLISKLFGGKKQND